MTLLALAATALATSPEASENDVGLALARHAAVTRDGTCSASGGCDVAGQRTDHPLDHVGRHQIPWNREGTPKTAGVHKPVARSLADNAEQRRRLPFRTSHTTEGSE